MNKKLTTKRKLSDLKPHPNNPRTITPDGMKLMEKSLTEFRKMLTVRPVVIDEKNTILGGHQKVEAAKKLGWKEIEVRKVEGWSEAKKKAFEEDPDRFIALDDIVLGAIRQEREGKDGIAFVHTMNAKLSQVEAIATRLNYIVHKLIDSAINRAEVERSQKETAGIVVPNRIKGL